VNKWICIIFHKPVHYIFTFCNTKPLILSRLLPFCLPDGDVTCTPNLYMCEIWGCHVSGVGCWNVLVSYALRTDKQWCCRGANIFIYKEEEKYLGLFDPKDEDTMLPQKDGKYLADDNAITSQNTWIFISLCLPTCSQYANWKWNIWYLQDGFSHTPRHMSLSLISRAWIWSALYFSATKLIFRIWSKISRFHLHYLLSR